MDIIQYLLELFLYTDYVGILYRLREMLPFELKKTFKTCEVFLYSVLNIHINPRQIVL